MTGSLNVRTLFLAILALSWASPVLAQASCAVADAMRDVQRFEASQRMYTYLLRQDSTLECARQGLEAIVQIQLQARHQYERGRAYQQAGRLDTARIAFLRALSIDPTMDDVAQALDALTTPSEVSSGSGGGSAFDQAWALSQLGLYQEARDVLKEMVKNQPGLVLPDSLRYLFGGHIGWWRTVRGLFEPLGVPLAEILIVFGVLVLMGLMLQQRLAPPLLDISDFDDGAVKASLGKDLAIMLENDLLRLTSGTPRGNVQLVSAPIEPISVPAEVQKGLPESISWITILPSIMAWLSPRRTYKLSGHLHWSNERGPGLTVVLMKRKKNIRSRILWEDDFDPAASREQSADGENVDPTRYYQLTEPIATWLLFQLSEIRQEAEGPNADASFELLGTTSWRSYALFRAGLRHEQKNNLDAAQRAYVQALARDAYNRAARVNLAGIFSDKKRYDMAVTHLERALREARAHPKSALDPVLYSALYRLASARFDLAAEHEKKGDHSTANTLYEKAEANAGELVEKIEAQLRKLRNEQNDLQKNPHLKPFLTSIEPTAQILFIGIRIKRSPHADEDLLEAFDTTSISSGTWYNAACAYSLLAEKTAAAQHDTYLDKSLRFLNVALTLNARTAARAQADASLDTVQDKAEARFNALIEQYTTPTVDVPSPLPLAGFILIGEDYAQRLAKLDIHTPDDLVLAAEDAAKRQQLANTLDVSVDYLKRWALAIDMHLQILGLTLEHANLLHAVQVSSLTDLAQSDTDLLTTRLAERSVAQGQAGQGPSKQQIERWIREAQGTSSRVL